MSLEVEVKIPLADLAATRGKLRGLGAVLRRERIFEDNVLYDTETLDLARHGRILRLRRAGHHVTITYKEPSAEPADPAMKVMRERECSASGPASFEELAAIFEGIGLCQVYRYQKHREEMMLGGVLVTVDETPIGPFLELEGAPDRIRAVAASLGVAEDAFVRESYRALHVRWCRERGVPIGDMVFGSGSGSGAVAPAPGPCVDGGGHP